MRRARCGKDAGFLRRRHRDCDREVALLTDDAADAVHDPEKAESLQSALNRTGLKASTRAALVRAGYEGGVGARRHS